MLWSSMRNDYHYYSYHSLSSYGILDVALGYIFSFYLTVLGQNFPFTNENEAYRG